jgi:FkbH-like protein
MKLIEALEILRRPIAELSGGITVVLACGFEPLHLRTFLAASLRTAQESPVDVATGLFGDLYGNIERIDPTRTHTLIVVVEWQDLDARLGLRSVGGWRPADVGDILKNVSDSAQRLQQAVSAAAKRVSAVICLPTLPLPPLFPTRPDQAGAMELSLRRMVASLAEELSQQRGVQIASGQLLDELSPMAGRYDVKGDVSTGFPYTLSHASAAAGLIAGLIRQRPPKKGLITDLDDTLWAGIAGEDGAEGVTWTLECKTHLHGLYQQLLASLAAAGVLIGVASKNDPATVERVFQRKDLLIGKDDIFPVEANWARKSESVRRILATWNIGAEAVVFIDDSPMEVAEVQAAFPEMECLVFPHQDYVAFLRMMRDLRDSFGKPDVTEEDALRLSSIRNSSIWRDISDSPSGAPEDFLKAAQGCVTIDIVQSWEDTRAFELVNKTNQFNLNGRRFTEQEWKSYLSNPAAFLLTASYGDKYGRLGKIAAMLGITDGRNARVDAWVMSCRAFSRRIEYQCLQSAFTALQVDEIQFSFKDTGKNVPLQQCLHGLFRSELTPGQSITCAQFAGVAPALVHRVEETVHA